MHQVIPRVYNCATLTAAILILLVASTIAQGPVPSPLIPQASPAPRATVPAVAPQPSPAAALTRQDFEAFLDALIPSQLQNRNIAGAVVSVVKDGQILFAKGYGYADFEAKKPVIAEQTLFRPGSISKLFTATAVMQLVEQGKLDLDRDVNDYLDFPIPKTYPEPVTLRRLLTHTAGFEEVLKNLFVPSARDVKPLRTYLINQMPARIFPPGKVSSYSNYGLTLAGYIVERVSGEKFESYIDNHILRPLRMTNSSFDQPPPAALASQMSQGYSVATKKPRPFEFANVAPAGSLSTTALDMTRFMLAFLQGGTLDGATILKPETVQEMEKRQFEFHPLLNGIGLTFLEYSMNGQHIVGHGGDTLWFHSDLILLPDAHVGYFISYNSSGKNVGGGRNEVLQAFADRYFPNQAEPKRELDANTARNDGKAVSGVYETTRRGETTVLKLLALLGQFKVSSDRDGVVTVEGFKNQRGEEKRWREIAPLVYSEIDGPDKIAFRRDSSGNVRELLPFFAVFEGQRVPWYASKTFLLLAVGGNLCLTLLTVLLWPIAVLIRRRYQRPLFTARSDRVIYFLSRIVCLCELLVILIPAIVFSRVAENISLLGDGADPLLTGIKVFAWITLAGIALLIAAAGRYAFRTGTGLWFRTHTILLALGGITFALFCWQYHLLDLSTKF